MVVRCLPAASVVIVLEELPNVGDAGAWTRLRLADGSDGWVPSEFLQRMPLVQLWSGFWPVAAAAGR